MGVATFLIGLLPTYEQIGPWAAVALVLLRVAQGFGVGGEWGGAVLMAVEHAPPGKRGFYGSWPQIGVPAGLRALHGRVRGVLAAARGTVPLLGLACAVPAERAARRRRAADPVRILETPAFAKVKEASREARQPIIEVLRTYPKQVLLAMGARFAENGAFYIYSVFVLDYATQHVKMPQQMVLNAILIGAAPRAGGDSVLRRAVGSGRTPPGVSVRRHRDGAAGVSAVPAARHRRRPPLVVARADRRVRASRTRAMYGPQAAFLSELFGTRVRYSGASLGAQLASVLAGGLSPFIATALLAQATAATRCRST